MIKKIGILAIACIIVPLQAQLSPSWLEVKPGYFFFSNHTLRKIYHGGFEIQGSGTFSLYGPIALYASLGYLRAKGKSLHVHEKTSIVQVPLDLGARAIADFNECLKGYMSIGPRFFYFHQRNDSIYVDRNIRRTGFGFFVNAGLNVINHDCFLVGLFGEYAFQQKSFRSNMPNVYGRRDLQIGGFTFGASVGIVF